MTNAYLPEGLLIAKPENQAYLSSLQGLEQALLQGRILEATALLCDNTLRLHIDLGGMRGYIEKQECLYCRPGESIKDIAVITRVGKPVCFKVMRIERDENGPYAVLSRRLAQQECYHSYLSDLINGDIIPAKVTHLENFGAFVDIGCGISSLLSIDCISVSRISHPRDRLAVGQFTDVAVKAIDRGNERIFVSLRELLGTWEENARQFKVGSTVAGVIRSIESYGIFVELSPNLAGLAETKDSRRFPMPSPDWIGRRAAVFIKSITPERMKIKLVLIDIAGKAELSALKHYVALPTVKHIDYWRYSPDGCSKVIETYFSTGR